MGLSPNQFFDLTPRLFHLLKDRHEERVRHAEWMTGILASVSANHSMRHPEKWMGPADYMPSLAGKSAKAPRLNRKKIAESIRGFIREQRNKVPHA